MLEASTKASYTAEEWESLKDLAEPDIPIPVDQFDHYMKSAIGDIRRWAEVRGLDLPDEAALYAELSDLTGIQESCDFTYFQMQRWHGEMKLQLALTALSLSSARQQDH